MARDYVIDVQLSGASIQCLASKDTTEGAWCDFSRGQWGKESQCYASGQAPRDSVEKEGCRRKSNPQLFFFPTWSTILSIVHPYSSSYDKIFNGSPYST